MYLKNFNSYDRYFMLLKMQNESEYRLIFVKIFWKFWGVADFREILTNG